VKEKGGKQLFYYYPSLELALRSIYPENPWQSSQFVAAKRVPQFHWQNDTNIMEALERAEKQMGIEKVNA